MRPELPPFSVRLTLSIACWLFHPVVTLPSMHPFRRPARSAKPAGSRPVGAYAVGVVVSPWLRRDEHSELESSPAGRRCGRAPRPHSAVKRRPADVIPQPLIVKH
jgi:hypothetical protein